MHDFKLEMWIDGTTESRQTVLFVKSHDSYAVSLYAVNIACCMVPDLCGRFSAMLWIMP